MVKNNPQATSKDHLAADGVTVHPSTIQRTLHKEKLYGRVMRKKPFLSIYHKQSCLRYAKANLDKPASYWNRVLWTDKTKIEIFGHNKPRYGWWQKNTAFQEKHLLPMVKFGILLMFRVAWIPLSISQFLRIMFKNLSQS